MPFFHSWINPINKINVKVVEVITHVMVMDDLIVIIIGITITISISKIKKIIAIMKKWIEKGIRE